MLWYQDAGFSTRLWPVNWDKKARELVTLDAPLKLLVKLEIRTPTYGSVSNTASFRRKNGLSASPCNGRVPLCHQCVLSCGVNELHVYQYGNIDCRTIITVPGTLKQDGLGLGNHELVAQLILHSEGLHCSILSSSSADDSHTA